MFDPTCVYKTPCGWCSKFDKKCDGKIANFKPIKITDEKTLKELVEKYTKE